jgi:peptide/nickel transport system permease protein
MGNEMASYVVARLVQSIPVLFLTSVAIFLFIHLIPGDPAIAVAGLNATPQQVTALRHRYELDRPLPVQYLAWVGRIAHGDLGTAYASQQPITRLLGGRLIATGELALGAMAVSLTFGAPLGVFAAIRPYHPVSRAVALFNAVAIATPSFWLGILLVLFFAVRLKWLPPSGYVPISQAPLAALKHLILPSVTLGLASSAILIRFLIASIAEVLGADFVRTAHAKGLPERAVVRRHVLKNALPPVITIMAIQLGYLLGGAVITESIFGWPGLGRLMLDAIRAREYLVIQDTMLIFVVTFILVNILADVCYAFLNPRIRFGR